MSIGLIVICALVILAIAMFAWKMIKAALFFVAVAVIVICVYVYGPDLLGQVETQFAPYVALAGSYF